MNKNRLTLHSAAILAIALFAFLAISSSITVTPPGKATIDPNLPQEKAAVVVFHSSVYIKEYNGMDVEKGWYPKANRRMTVTMPAGETHLLFDLYASFDRGNTTYTFRPKDLELKFNFEAGKEYTVGLYTSSNEGTLLFPKQKIVLAIWDQIYPNADPGRYEEDHVLKAWELGEF